MLENIPHFVFSVRHLTKSVIFGTNKLFRFPKRIIKAAEEDEHLISRPAIAVKRKRRLLRAPYLETNVKVETKHNAEQQLFKDPSGKFSWRNLDVKSDILIEKIRSMRNRQKRRIANTILLEGKNLIMEALAAGIQLQHVLFCDLKVLEKMPLPDEVDKVRISTHRMNTWSLLDSPPGIMAIAKKPTYEEISKSKDSNILPLTVICDGMKDPGNVGSLIRSLAAIGCRRILAVTGCCYFWEVKVLRSASGAHFYIPVYEDISWNRMLDYLPHDFFLYLADSNVKNQKNEESLLTTCFQRDTEIVLVVGSERTGLRNVSPSSFGSCDHVSGISPMLVDFDQIRLLQRPLHVPKIGLIVDLLNAEPKSSIQGYVFNEKSNSNINNLIYGENVVHQFCNDFAIDMIIRGHENVEKGYAFFAEEKMLSIFSCLNYEDNNEAAVVEIYPTLEIQLNIFRQSESSSN
ncbi:RNA methyltransferase-like protein 1B [Trichinella zimbabwensis]|uniref:RNA methyltransferase-like protein 1B n=1 Tax=Trichinella zimbabwensis TaxID=268475 RepID=A0A0V1GVS2_9BILA|nr:RNA methyltransferase-like protein 1B [Trichinella zimbabwensis]KRZ02271.1 RNA methyltransferase-like protein 1B [Trichinella zimbabwensis]